MAKRVLTRKERSGKGSEPAGHLTVEPKVLTSLRGSLPSGSVRDYRRYLTLKFR